MTVTPPARRRGRYAEGERNDRLVLDAAREVVAALGAEAPVSAIAQRAGVGMGTLYRRYGSKTELLQRLCVLAMDQALAAAGEALGASDPWEGLTGYVRACVELRSGARPAGAWRGRRRSWPGRTATAGCGPTSPRWTSPG